MAKAPQRKRGCKRPPEGGTERICSRKTKGGIRKGRIEKYLKVHVPFHSLEMPESQKPCLHFRAICQNLQAQKRTHARCLHPTNPPLFSAPVNCLQQPNTCWTKGRRCRQEQMMTEGKAYFSNIYTQIDSIHHFTYNHILLSYTRYQKQPSQCASICYQKQLRLYVCHILH